MREPAGNAGKQQPAFEFLAVESAHKPECDTVAADFAERPRHVDALTAGEACLAPDSGRLPGSERLHMQRPVQSRVESDGVYHTLPFVFVLVGFII